MNRSTLVSTYGLAVAITLIVPAVAGAQSPTTPTPATADLQISNAEVRIHHDLEVLVFQQSVRGRAGHTNPQARGQLDGAPVLGYVFPTTLAPEDVGFAAGEGVVALAATAHPDFDDTPLWDEDGDGDFDNDGVRFHSHWVVLVPDDRVPGGLSVKAAQAVDDELPPTNPGMPMYLDSPGFNVVLKDEAIRIVVPLERVDRRTDFRFDAVTVYMEVNTSDPDRPLLGVYEVYQVLSGDLSLPYQVRD